METLLDWQMNERFDIQDIFHHGLKECCIYGTSIAYAGWKWEEKQLIKKQQVPVYDIDPMTGEDMIDPETGEPMQMYDDNGEPVTDWQPMKVNEITYDDPELKFIDLGLFYVDPSATDIDDARYCGHDEFMTKEQLQKLADQGIYKINWKQVAKEKNTNKARDFRLSQIGMPTSDDQIEESDEDSLYRVIS